MSKKYNPRRPGRPQYTPVGAGDLVRMLPSDYGKGMVDQWVGTLGIVLKEDYNDWLIVLAKHSDDNESAPIYVKKHQVEIVSKGHRGMVN